jgi:hypothetical protein
VHYSPRRGGRLSAAPRITLRASAVLLFAATMATAAPVFATTPIVRVEEDWELRLLNPDPMTQGPQVSCVISPTSGTSSLHAVLEVNQRSEPYYAAGGLQLQLWDGARLLSVRNYPRSELLATAGETVRWTQRMRLVEGSLVVEVINGTSTTWGAFGGQGYLKETTSTSLTTLAGYQPAVSVDHSGIGFAANRVSALVLKEVRAYAADGTEYRSTVSHTVYEQ